MKREKQKHNKNVDEIEEEKEITIIKTSFDKNGLKKRRKKIIE